MGLVKWQRHGCCTSHSGTAARRCILQEEKTFFKQVKNQLISFCNPRELVASSDLNKSAKDDTLLLK